MITIKMTNALKRSPLALAMALSLGLSPLSVLASQASDSQEPLMIARIPSECLGCGVIADIEKVTHKKKKKASGLGAVTGAVVGGVIGHNVGHGDSATAGGAIVGGIAGHQIEKKNAGTVNGESYYRVSISMDGGGTQEINLHSVQGLSIGQRVRVEDGNINLE